MSWLLSPAASTIDLGDLSNVDLTGAGTGELLYYDGADWTNTGTDYVWNPTGGTDNSGTFGELRLGNGSFAAGDANLHIDQITAAGEANEYLLLLASNGSPRFSVQRDGDLAFYSYIQIPGGDSLRWSGANTRIEGNASSNITIHTNDGTERAEFNSYGFGVTGGHALRIYDATDTDYAAMSHDGTDFNVALTTTTDVNFTGATGGYFFDEDLHVTAGAVTASAVVSDNGQVGQFAFMDVTGGVGRFGSYDYDTSLWKDVEIHGDAIDINSQGSSINFQYAGANVATMGSSNIDILGGLDLRIRDAGSLFIFDSTDSDSVEMSHDGTDFNIAATTTTAVNFTGVTAARGYTFDQDIVCDTIVVDDGGTAPGIIFEHAAVDNASILAYSGTLDIDVGSNSNNRLQIVDTLTTMVRVDSTDGLVVYGGGQETDYCAMAHDGTDFTFSFTNTGQVDFDTGVNAPSKSRDISASTNTASDDYGRIIRMTGGSGQTFTLDSDPPEDAYILFDNASGNSWTIATSPTTNLIWAKDATTGNRTLADDGMALAIHRGSGVWIINGSDLLT